MGGRVKITIGILLIIFGSVLEVLYYIFRYTAEGTHISWAVIQGISLTILLIAFFLLGNGKSKWWFLPAFILALYSIANTSAGQRQALINKAEEQVVQINSGIIIDRESTLERKKDRYDKISEMLDTSIVDFDDYWEWQNTTKKYESEQSGLLNDIEELGREISVLRNPVIEASSNMEIYIFWGDIFGFKNTDRIQFLMQVIFSFFIAITAPVGTMVLSWGIDDFKDEKKKRVKNAVKTPKKKAKIMEPDKPKIEQKKEPDKIIVTDKSYFAGLTKRGVSNIIIMLTSHDGYPGFLLDSLNASEEFKKLEEQGKKMYPYSVEQCQRVAKWIHANKLMGKTMETIVKASEEYFK